MELRSAGFLRAYNRAGPFLSGWGHRKHRIHSRLWGCVSWFDIPLRVARTERKQATVHIPVLLLVENHKCYSGLCGGLGKQCAGFIPVGRIGGIKVQHLTSPAVTPRVDRFSLTVTSSSPESRSGISSSFRHPVRARKKSGNTVITKFLKALTVRVYLVSFSIIFINRLWEPRQRLPRVLHLLSENGDSGGRTVEAPLPAAPLSVSGRDTERYIPRHLPCREPYLPA